MHLSMLSGGGGRSGRSGDLVILTFGQEFLSKSSPPDNMFCQSLPKKVTLIFKQILHTAISKQVIIVNSRYWNQMEICI